MTDENQIRGLREHNERLNQIITESLQQSLLLLMEKEEYQKISITQICNKAGVSRMAFYSNFETKDNLLETIVIELNNRLIKKIGSPFRDYVNVNWYKTLFEVIKDYSRTLKLFFKVGFKYKYISIINNLVLHDPTISDKVRYSRLMWSGGIANIMIDWIENDMRVPIDKIATYCLDSFKYVK